MQEDAAESLPGRWAVQLSMKITNVQVSSAVGIAEGEILGLMSMSFTSFRFPSAEYSALKYSQG